MKRLICWLRQRHVGPLGVNPERQNTEAKCRTCGTWFHTRGISLKGDFHS